MLLSWSNNLDIWSHWIYLRRLFASSWEFYWKSMFDYCHRINDHLGNTNEAISRVKCLWRKDSRSVNGGQMSVWPDSKVAKLFIKLLSFPKVAQNVVFIWNMMFLWTAQSDNKYLGYFFNVIFCSKNLQKQSHLIDNVRRGNLIFQMAGYLLGRV